MECDAFDDFYSPISYPSFVLVLVLILVFCPHFGLDMNRYQWSAKYHICNVKLQEILDLLLYFLPTRILFL